jgi:deoxycytidylate deaminase
MSLTVTRSKPIVIEYATMAAATPKKAPRPEPFVAASPSGAAAGSMKEGGFAGSSPGETSKRTDYLSWDDYFMSLAFLSAQRSKVGLFLNANRCQGGLIARG